MRIGIHTLITSAIICLLVTADASAAGEPDSTTIHIWQMTEIVLKTHKKYDNYYTDVTCWVDLKAPNFSKRVYGF